MRWIISLAGAAAAAVTGAAAGGHFRPDAGSLAGQIRAPRLETAATGRRLPSEDKASFDLASTIEPGPTLYSEADIPPPLPPPPEEAPPSRRLEAVTPRPSAEIRLAHAPPAPAAGDWAQDAQQVDAPPPKAQVAPIVIPERTPYY